MEGWDEQIGVLQPARHNHQPIHQQGTRWAGNAWPKITKNANFGPNFVVFGQKILILTGESKSFGTHIPEDPPMYLVCIVFWSEMWRNRPKMPIFGPKWPKMHILDKIWPFWAKNSYLTGGSKSFGTHVTEKPPRHLVCIVFWSATGPNGPEMPIFGKMPNLVIFRSKINFWVDGLKLLVSSELWVIFRSSPLFLAVLGLCHSSIISTLNFGPFSM